MSASFNGVAVISPHWNCASILLWRILSAKLLVCAAFLSGCRTTLPTAKVWVEEPFGGIDRPVASLPMVAESFPRPVNLTASINEATGFLFAIRPDVDSLEYPEFRLSPFSAPGARMDPSAVELFRVHPVTVGTQPGWHVRAIPPASRVPEPLDVLVPLAAPRGGLPRRMEPGVTYYYWADVWVAKGTAAADYSSSVQLFAAGRFVANLPVRLTVLPIVLPDEADIVAVAEVDHVALLRHHVRSATPLGMSAVVDWYDSPRRAQYESLLASTTRVLQRHRLTPVFSDLNPPIRVSSRGELSIDWRGYDAIVSPLLDGSAFSNRVPLHVWPIPLGEAFERTLDRERSPTGGSDRLLRDFVALYVDHFAESDWLNRAYALAPSMRPGSVEAVESIRRFASLVRSVDDRIAVASQLFPQDMSAFGWTDYAYTSMGDDVRIWIPPAQFFDVVAMADQRRAGSRTWLGVDRPPYSGTCSVHAPPAFTEVLPWQADALDADALWLGCINHWPADLGAADANSCIDLDDRSLLFPGLPFGLDEPVMTLRLKRIRTAMQSAAYGQLLRQHGRDQIVATLRDSLVRYAGAEAYRTHYMDGRSIGWTDREEAFELARRIMIEEMRGVVTSSEMVVPPRSIDRTVLWNRFFDLTREVTVRVDGARLRAVGRPGALAADLDLWLTVTNGTQEPLNGVVALTNLPDDWLAETESRSVGPIPSRQSSLATLGARISQIGNSESTFRKFALEFTSDGGSKLSMPIRLSVVQAMPTPRPPTIDGDLSDWPPGATNLASDFRLIAGECVEASLGGIQGDADCSRPTNRTFGFVSRDGENLFVALNAETTPGAAIPAATRRSVRYDDMIPADDDDLIELLIDPLNGGSRSPGDLFHIVVKRSGAALVEKGIGFDPPCAPRSAWPADIDVATRVAPDRWTAELRIPLAAFGRGVPVGEIWGFNLTRLDALNREFSTWSGAMGNAYDPLSLGNLIFP